MSWEDISDDIFERLLPFLARCHLKSLHRVNRRYNSLIKAHVTHLSPRHFHPDIPFVFPNVTQLNLSRAWNQVNDDALMTMVKSYVKSGRRLKKLDVSKCHGVTNKGINAVSQHLSHLEELNLNGCRSAVPASYVGYTGVSGETLHRLKHMEKLHLRWNPVTDHSIKTITKLRHLRYLDLGKCHGMSEVGMLELRRFVQMEILDLEHTMVSRDGISALAELPMLSTLNLSNCSEINDDCLRLLSRFMALEVINLGRLNNITDEGVRQLVHLPKLKKLDLSYCTQLTGSWIEGSMDDTEWGITHLNLADCCNWVTSEVLEALTERMMFLSELVLHNCIYIGGRGLSKLIKCPLQKLDVSLCYDVEDQELHIISKYQNLKELNLAFCSHVTDEGLSKLQNLKHLRSLVLNCCRRITAEGIRSLWSLRGTLRRLELSACHGIDPDTMFFISNWFDELTLLNVAWLAVTDTHFRSFKNLKRLNRVDIRGCHELTDEMLQEFWYLEGVNDMEITG